MNAIRAIGQKAREIARLTGQSFWRGFIGFYNSDNLTYAASIAYYALLSLFPFFLLAFALLGRSTAAVDLRRRRQEGGGRRREGRQQWEAGHVG